MNISAWQACIISTLDLIGTKAAAPTGKATSRMLRMHQFAAGHLNSGLPSHDCGYIWNDSVMLLSYRTKPAEDRRRLLLEVSAFKRALESHCGAKAYVVSVMGVAFPMASIASSQAGTNTPRAVVLKASSWAMANCSLIENKLKRHKADWYIDWRVARGAGLPKPFAEKSLALLPHNESRAILMYKGSLD